MTAQEVLDQYASFLWEQFQYDWGWMSEPWVLYTLFPVAAYICFFLCKWTILLAPVTIPIMILKWPNKDKVTIRETVIREDKSIINN